LKHFLWLAFLVTAALLAIIRLTLTSSEPVTNGSLLSGVSIVVALLLLTHDPGSRK
jgi:hypothetical protein